MTLEAAARPLAILQPGGSISLSDTYLTILAAGLDYCGTRSAAPERPRPRNFFQTGIQMTVAILILSALLELALIWLWCRPAPRKRAGARARTRPVHMGYRG